MASKTKQYSAEKLNGKVYTPPFIVEKILDDTGYNTPAVLGKKIVDPACGDGRFLTAIARRIIQFSPKNKLKDNLSQLYGWDTDPEAVRLAIDNLNQLIKPYNIQIEWQISVRNALRDNQVYKNYFDFITGNPPYIRIQHLAEKDRIFIQKNYRFCQSGATDIYIAFIELSLQLLKPGGRTGLITPNTFFHTETAQALRNYLADNQLIIQLSNYGSLQVFDQATTYSAISILGKNPKPEFVYQKALDLQRFNTRHIHFSEIKNQKFWQLSGDKQKPLQQGVRLGDIANIHVGITTLADKYYIMPRVITRGQYMELQTRSHKTILIEKDILKPIIKASTLKSGQEAIKEYVLFPYQKKNGKYEIIPENILMEKYPKAYKYFTSIKPELAKRDNGKPNKTAWYAFGRNQSLQTGFGKKILFSPMNKHPRFILSENADATFYSGYCIKYEGDYNRLLKQLNSERMAAFIEVSSRDFRGGWKAYNKKIVQEFLIDQTKL